jgi:hypothetical protein
MRSGRGVGHKTGLYRFKEFKGFKVFKEFTWFEREPSEHLN